MTILLVVGIRIVAEGDGENGGVGVKRVCVCMRGRVRVCWMVREENRIRNWGK